jgi:3-(methylthio)propanoyl-CoA dehydrogenase
MYRAPIKDLSFVLNELIGAQALQGCPDFADYSPDVAGSVLEEAARFAEEVLDPLNKTGDREGVHWSEQGVKTAKGFKEAYRQFVEGGWPQLATGPEHGGQGMPQMVATSVQEILGSANLSFKLCPMLTYGAIEALALCGTPEQKSKYLPKMVSGEWTGTMNLTEPQAGSDLAQVRSRAAPEGNHYRLFGQKIFITWGEHDFTDNIIHMVLARIDGAPPGVRGISLFIVPKILVNDDGSLGQPNEVRCVSVEHKLGIHASPTCVMAYGDQKGAVAYLVGEANRGLEYMFIMMNAARLAVGLEGYALAERAYQQALEWANNRVQGKPPGVQTSGPAPIVHHPDVKRMLLAMKSSTEAMRALGLYAAFQLDLARHHEDAKTRETALARAELLIPIVKGWCTELGIDITSLGIQVHGGMGFIEETGAAQYLRDVRITAIYEGTTGIQSNDLINRKIGRDRGATMQALIAEMQRELQALSASEPTVQSVARAALEGVGLLREATDSILGALAVGPEHAYAVSVPYLELCGYVIGGWLMAKSSAIAAGKISGADAAFYKGKLRTTRFYADQVLPQAIALARTVKGGAASVLETDAALL